MKTISSRHNPLVRRFREAVRDHADEIVIEGPKAVADAIASGWKPLALLTRAGSELPIDPPSATPVAAIPTDVFRTLTETKTSQGVLGLFERPAATAAKILARREAVTVALDGIQDPGNVGTIVRLAAAFDAAGVLLLPGCADAYGPKAIRSSVGAVLNVPVAQVSVDELLASGLPLVAADASGECSDPPTREAILVFGSEGTGVSREILRVARRLAIPTSARVESLNVAAAAAILLARSYSLRA
jgi:TrmH family RNA methyltransferase